MIHLPREIYKVTILLGLKREPSLIYYLYLIFTIEEGSWNV